MSLNSMEPKQTHKAAVDVVKLLFFLMIMLATIIGNSFVCMAVASFRNLRTHTNLVLVSLAATDLFMVFVMALNATTAVTAEWSLGEAWCDNRLHLYPSLVFSQRRPLHSYPLAVSIPIPCNKTARLINLAVAMDFPIVALHLPIADISFRGQVYGCSIRGYTPTHSQMFYTFIMVAVFVAAPFSIMLITHAYVFTVAFRHARRLGLMERSVRAISKGKQFDGCSSSRESTSKSIGQFFRVQQPSSRNQVGEDFRAYCGRVSSLLPSLYYRGNIQKVFGLALDIK